MTEERELFYIEPVDSETNRRLFENFLQGRSEDVCEQKKCTEGPPVNVFRVSRTELAKCIINRRTSALNFNIFVDRGEGLVKVQIAFSDSTTNALAQGVASSEVLLTCEHVGRLVEDVALRPISRHKPSFPCSPKGEKWKVPRRIFPRDARRI